MVDNVKDIIKAYCSVHYPGADGLCNDGCGCSFDDLQPCSSSCMHCVPAKWNGEEEIFIEIDKYQ